MWSHYIPYRQACLAYRRQRYYLWTGFLSFLQRTVTKIYPLDCHISISYLSLWRSYMEYAPLFTPSGISWEGHLSGAIIGTICAFLLWVTARKSRTLLQMNKKRNPSQQQMKQIISKWIKKKNTKSMQNRLILHYHNVTNGRLLLQCGNQ